MKKAKELVSSWLIYSPSDSDGFTLHENATDSDVIPPHVPPASEGSVTKSLQESRKRIGRVFGVPENHDVVIREFTFTH